MRDEVKRCYFDEKKCGRSIGLALGLCLGMHLAAFWFAPVLPGQDLPQHLAYARIFADYRSNHLYQDLYQLPERFQTYFLSYYALAGLAPIMPVTVATRLLFSLYAVAMVGAFAALVRATHRLDRGLGIPSTTPLAALIIWNPLAAMGFFEFVLTGPIFVFGFACYLRLSVDGERWTTRVLLVAMAVLLASLHVAAAGMFVLFVTLHAALKHDGRSLEASLLAIASTALAFAVWNLVGEPGLGSMAGIDWLDRSRANAGLSFISEAMTAKWNDPLTKIGYAAWALLGPFRFTSQVTIAAILGAVFYLADRRNRAPSDAFARETTRFVMLMLGICFLIPWGIYVPTEFTFIDFRVLTYSVLVGLACISPALFSSPRAVLAIAGAAVLVSGHFAWQTFQLGREVAPAISLLRRATPGGMMASLSFKNQSAFFGDLFRVTHFLPMYYTVEGAGANTQFWAKYTDHLPIGYKAGRDPGGTADWAPDTFRLVDLKRSNYLFVEKPFALSSKQTWANYSAVMEKIRFASALSLLDCHGDYCLYRVDPSKIPEEPLPGKGGI